MQSKANTPEAYLAELPEERRQIITDMRQIILDNLPKGFEEMMNYGMLGYVIPHSIYPPGYHCDPKLPLPLMHLASQKNYISLYHGALYTGLLLEWFQEQWPNHSTRKLDMGKCCVRFKKPEHVPLALIGQLATKVTPKQWIAAYEAATEGRR